MRTAIIGAGFMGRVHLEALRRLGNVEVYAVVSRRAEAARKLAGAFRIERYGTDYQEILADSAVDAVHICTPNAHHFEMAKHALNAGKHVLCEKPLTISVEQARTLTALAEKKQLHNCTCHNLRYYPMVQQMRCLCEAGDLGDILIVQGTYSQDWLLYETDWNWRVDSREAGPSRAMADIGSHWADMAEHVTGLRITLLCADLATFHAVRQQATGAVETFAGKSAKLENRAAAPVSTDDFGAVMFRMGERTRGAFTASQVSAGRKNRLCIEIYGTKGSVSWDQERPDELWIGRRDQNNQILIKDPALMKDRAREFADLPGGHSEGYDDTFKQVFRRFYEAIEKPDAPPEYPQFADGLRQLNILEAELASHAERRWVEISSPN